MSSGWPQPRPEEIEQALDWLRQQDPGLRLDRLADDLRRAGFDPLAVQAAVAERQDELDAALPASIDLRGRVSAVLIVAFLLGWAIPTFMMLSIPGSAYLIGGSGLLLTAILAALLTPVGILAVLVARRSSSLRRGSVGMAVAILVVPFVWLVAIAGTCATFVAGTYRA